MSVNRGKVVELLAKQRKKTKKEMNRELSVARDIVFTGEILWEQGTEFMNYVVQTLDPNEEPDNEVTALSSQEDQMK